MSDQVITVTHRNVNYHLAKEFARIEQDAFKDDVILQGYWPAHTQFGRGYLPHLADYEDLQQRVKLFGKLVDSIARWAEVMIRKDPRMILYLLKSGETGKFVAGSLWVLPTYVPHDTIPWYRRVMVWFREMYYYFLEGISFLTIGNPARYTNFMTEFDWASKQLGGENTPERRKELEGMSRKQLEEVVYPRDLCFYLYIMVVRTDGHGKGYGKQLLNKAKHLITAGATPPPNIDGPVKISLFSAPTAYGFYQRIGMSIGAQINHTLPNGREITHRYMFENVE